MELERLLAEYLVAAESGSAPPLAEWIDRHPEFRTELLKFFALRRDIEAITSPSAPTQLPPRSATSESPAFTAVATAKSRPLIPTFPGWPGGGFAWKAEELALLGTGARRVP